MSCLLSLFSNKAAVILNAINCQYTVDLKKKNNSTPNNQFLNLLRHFYMYDSFLTLVRFYINAHCITLYFTFKDKYLFFCPQCA